jgi:hypothetical protein
LRTLRLELVNIVSGLASVGAWIEQGELSHGDLPLVAEILIDGATNAIMAPASAPAFTRLRAEVVDLTPTNSTFD